MICRYSFSLFSIDEEYSSKMKLFLVFLITFAVANCLVSNYEIINNCRGECINEVNRFLKFTIVFPKNKFIYFKFLDTFTSVYNIDEQCKNGEDCSTCWRSCKLIFHLKHSMVKQLCQNREKCTEGCKYACKFYRVEKRNERRTKAVRINTKKDCTNCLNNDIIKYLLK